MRDVDSEMGKQTTTHSESDQSLEIEASFAFGEFRFFGVYFSSLILQNFSAMSLLPLYD